MRLGRFALNLERMCRKKVRDEHAVCSFATCSLFVWVPLCAGRQTSRGEKESERKRERERALEWDKNVLECNWPPPLRASSQARESRSARALVRVGAQTSAKR